MQANTISDPRHRRWRHGASLTILTAVLALVAGVQGLLPALAAAETNTENCVSMSGGAYWINFDTGEFCDAGSAGGSSGGDSGSGATADGGGGSTTDVPEGEAIAIESNALYNCAYYVTDDFVNNIGFVSDISACNGLHTRSTQCNSLMGCSDCVDADCTRIRPTGWRPPKRSASKNAKKESTPEKKRHDECRIIMRKYNDLTTRFSDVFEFEAANGFSWQGSQTKGFPSWKLVSNHWDWPDDFGAIPIPNGSSSTNGAGGTEPGVLELIRGEKTVFVDRPNVPLNLYELHEKAVADGTYIMGLARDRNCSDFPELKPTDPTAAPHV